MPNKRKLFIGCSREAKYVADWVEKSLTAKSVDVEIHIWDKKKNWKNAKSTLDSLIKITTEFYYSIFVFHPDDFINLKGSDFWITRDNVVFESGLFFSQFGGERAFILKPYILENHPTNNDFRVLNDIDGLEFTQYKLQFNQTLKKWSIDLSDVFTNENIESLCDDIINKENELNILAANAKNEIDRVCNFIEADLKKQNENEEFYLNSFAKKFDNLIRFKSLQISKPVHHILNDIVIAVNKINDVLDIGQLAIEQSKAVNGNLKTVWVFAEEPLEFKSIPAGHALKVHFDELRKTILANLKAKVNYVYFVDNGFDLKNFTSLVGRQTHLLKYIEVIKCDKKNFLSFFTLHFEHQPHPAEIFVSFIDKQRDDLLIKIPDPKQIATIFENLQKIKGSSDIANKVKVFDRTQT